MATSKRFSRKLKKSDGMMALETVVKLILALIVSIPLLLLIVKGSGWFWPESVSTKEVKTIAVEITQLRDQIDNTDWQPGDTKVATITLPVQLKKGLAISVYTYSPQLSSSGLPPPSEKCKEVSCLDLKKDGSIKYIQPLPKNIVFVKNEPIIHGDNKIVNLQIDLVRDDSKNQYIASLHQISDQQPVPQTQEPVTDPSQIT